MAREQIARNLNRRLALLEGRLFGMSVVVESFVTMNVFRRLWWALTGRFNRSRVYREAMQQKAEAEAAVGHQAPAS